MAHRQDIWHWRKQCSRLTVPASYLETPEVAFMLFSVLVSRTSSLSSRRWKERRQHTSCRVCVDRPSKIHFISHPPRSFFTALGDFRNAYSFLFVPDRHWLMHFCLRARQPTSASYPLVVENSQVYGQYCRGCSRRWKNIKQ